MTTPRYLALGDSYTIGEAVPADLRWPAQVCARLAARGMPLIRPEIIAVTGWTVAELNAAIDSLQPEGPYDIVSLLVGVNDQYRGGTVEAYAPAFEAMLQRAIGFAGGDASKVVVVSIPDYGFTPHGEAKKDEIARALDAFNAANAAAAHAAGAHYVDITPTSRSHQEGWVAEDGLHPSGAQYTAWADLIEPVFDQVLGAPSA